MIALNSAHVLFMMSSLLLGFTQLIQGLEFKKNTHIYNFAWPFGKKYFSFLVQMQILISLCILYFHHWTLYLALLLIQIFYAKKWRGTINGGSDMMSFTITFGLFIASLPVAPQTQIFKHVGILIISVQSFLSYCLAGWVKIKNSDWRSGKALAAFLKTSRYQSPPSYILGYSLVFSWAVILFELSLPFALLNSIALYSFLLIAFIFHAMNSWYFGLNRFLWTWAATWPSLIYLSQVIVKNLAIS